MMNMCNIVLKFRKCTSEPYGVQGYSKQGQNFSSAKKMAYGFPFGRAKYPNTNEYSGTCGKVVVW